MDSNNTNGVATDIVTYEGEQYKAIPYAPKYYVSRTGKVLSTKGKQPRILRFKKGEKYKGVTLRVNKVSVPYDVHRLVADMYIPKPPDPTGEVLEVHHKDFDPANNNVDNLEWLPRSVHRKLHAELKKKKQQLDIPQARKPRKRKAA